MAEQPVAIIDVLKWLGGLAASGGAYRVWSKSRNANHQDRITRLEQERAELRHDLADIREELTELSTTLGSNERRLRQLEVTSRDLDREVRDTLQRMIETIDRRLRGTRVESEPPHAT